MGDRSYCGTFPKNHPEFSNSQNSSTPPATTKASVYVGSASPAGPVSRGPSPLGLAAIPQTWGRWIVGRRGAAGREPTGRRAVESENGKLNTFAFSSIAALTSDEFEHP